MFIYIQIKISSQLQNSRKIQYIKPTFQSYNLFVFEIKKIYLYRNKKFKNKSKNYTKKTMFISRLEQLRFMVHFISKKKIFTQPKIKPKCNILTIQTTFQSYNLFVSQIKKTYLH